MSYAGGREVVLAAAALAHPSTGAVAMAQSMLDLLHQVDTVDPQPSTPTLNPEPKTIS
jgi:hypothetical protein